jgi:hypothetical protein
MRARELPWLWLVALALAWPTLHLALFLLRFRRLPDEGVGSALIFLPMGVVASLGLGLLLLVAHDARGRGAILRGYLLASPVAFVGSLVGGLMLPPLAGTILFGAGPLLLGAALGSLASRSHAQA